MKTLRLTFKPWISSDYGNVFMLLIYSKVTSWERISHLSSGIDQMFLQGFHITRSGSRKLPSRIRRNNGSLWKIEIVVCIMSWNAFCFTWKTTFVFAFNLRNQLICRPVFHATYRADKTRPRWGQFQTSEQWHSNFKVFFWFTDTAKMHWIPLQFDKTRLLDLAFSLARSAQNSWVFCSLGGNVADAHSVNRRKSQNQFKNSNECNDNHDNWTRCLWGRFCSKTFLWFVYCSNCVYKSRI